MTIVKTSEINLGTREPLSKKEIFRMCNSQTTQRLKDVVGVEMDVAAFVVYEDADKKTGTMQNIMVLMDSDGVLYGTNSNTFQSYFTDIWEYFKDDADGIPTLLICEGTTKNDRTFVYPDIV